MTSSFFNISFEIQRKTKERIKLTRDIKTRDFKILSYFYYIKKGRRYIIDSDQSSRYIEYIYRKCFCDDLVDSQDKNISRENNQIIIERQENTLEEQEERAVAQAQEAMARVARLYK